MSANAASVFRNIAQRRKTCRRFEPGRTIPEAVLKDILQSTVRAPSSFNLQPSQIVLVQSQLFKDALSDHAMLGVGNQSRTRQASAVAVFLSDLEPTKRLSKISQLEKGYRHPNYLATMPLSISFLIGEGQAATMIKGITTQFLSAVQPMPDVEPVQAWSYKNTGLLAQSFVFAAESHDLATAIMEGFDSRRVRNILRIPDRYAVPLMVATGFEYEEEPEAELNPRLNLSEVVFRDSFGKGWVPSDAERIGSFR